MKYWYTTQRRNVIIFFVKTALGQSIVYHLRTKTPGFWDRTKRLRSWLLAVSEIKSSFESYSQTPKTPEVNSHSKRTFSGKLSDIGVTIYSPDMVNGFHTITELARFQASNLRKFFPVTSFLDNQNPNSKYIMSFDTKLMTLNFENPISFGVGVYHLGNNPQSVKTLYRFFQSHKSTTVVVLHDIFLLDLFQAYYLYIGKPELFKVKVVSRLGAAGPIELLKLQKGEGITLETKRNLSSVFLEEIGSHAKIIISHSSDHLFPLIEESRLQDKNVVLALPSAYLMEQTSNLITTKKSKPTRIMVSGHASLTKEFHTLLEALEIVKGEIPGIDIVSAGTVGRQLEDAIRREPNFLGLGIKFGSKKELSDIGWRKFHQSGSIGIRLGVGENGESSGLIRDYLYFGMKVISDENTQSLLNHSDYFSVSKSADKFEISTAILNAMSSPIGNHQSLVTSHQQDYILKLSEILKAL